jgi:PAS domain S-box-containing protein
LTEVLYNAVVYRNQAGEVDGVFAAARDVTEQNRILQELKTYRGHLEEIVNQRTAELEATNDHLLKEIEERKQAQARVTSIARFPAENPSPVMRVDRQSRLVYANQSSREILGTWNCQVGERVPAEIEGMVKRALLNGKPLEHEIGLDGRSISLILSPSLPDGDVNIYGRDITGLKASEYVRALLEASLDPLVAINQEGKITDVNGATEKATGLSRTRLIGSDFSEYFTDTAKAREGYCLVLKNGLVKDYALTLLHASGATMEVLYNAAVYRNAAGEIQGVFAAARDITERKQLEERLRRAEQMKLLGQLTSGVAHEVRNPLNAIMAVTEALFQEIGDNPEYGPYMVHIRSQVERLSVLMTDLLELGKPMDNSRLSRISIASILTNVLSIWEHSPLKDKCIIHRLQPSSARQWYVMADLYKIQQVFYNLLENACQHSPQGGEIHFFISSPRGNCITVRIVDQGPGIPCQNTERVFEPFFTTRKGGIGLGLSIVKHVLALHHGEITLKNNEPPPGLTAEIWLPLAAEEA